MKVDRAQSCREIADSVDIKKGASTALEEEVQEKEQLKMIRATRDGAALRTPTGQVGAGRLFKSVYLLQNTGS